VSSLWNDTIANLRYTNRTLEEGAPAWGVYHPFQGRCPAARLVLRPRNASQEEIAAASAATARNIEKYRLPKGQVKSFDSAEKPCVHPSEPQDERRSDRNHWSFSVHAERIHGFFKVGDLQYGRASKVGVISRLDKAFFLPGTVSNRHVSAPFINFIHDIVHFAFVVAVPSAKESRVVSR